jgi:hypothetical protein
VDEDDRLLPLRVGAVDLLLFMGREDCHVVLLPLGVSVGSIGQIVPYNASACIDSQRWKRSWLFVNTSAIIQG